MAARANPFAGAKFYVAPGSHAKKQAKEWSASRPADAAQMEKIAAQPRTYYFNERTATMPEGTTARVDRLVSKITGQGALPVLGAYAIPHRDCDSFSGGGFATADQYQGWIQDFARGIGDRKAVVVLEPDALAGSSCLWFIKRWERFALLADAVDELKARPNIWVYIDAGHPGWRSAEEMAHLLQRAGIERADGFTLNVSNFYSTVDNISYGKEISSLTDGKHFVVDTSRNGAGPYEGGTHSGGCAPQFNPPGRALGARPTAETGEALADAYFWLKQPGESDGACGSYPRAGAWVPEYALGLAQRAPY